MTAAAHPVWAVPCAVGAAAAFGVANVLQMRAARRTATAGGIDFGLLVRLVRDRLWLAGLGASVLGFLLQATALFLAPVVLVQPLIVTELLFALPLAASLGGARLSRRDWTGALLVAGGIAAFMLVANPTGQRTHISAQSWVLVIGCVAGTVAVLAAVGETHMAKPVVRASALAAAASVCFGLLSVVTKVVGHQFADHGAAALLQPQPWVLTAAALTGLLLAQTAFRIAPLSVSLPLIDVGEPVVASVIAVTAFGENLGSGAGIAVGVAASAVMVAAGVAVLDSSPVARDAQQRISDESQVSASGDLCQQAG